MISSNFILADYLNRIGYKGQTNPDLSTLKGLMSAQLQTIPFENTEVQAGRIPSMIPEEITEKIVTHGRGGYCYEVNGLFAMALSAIGFEWYFAGARPMFYPTRRPKTHLVVIVSVDGESYLCDTGFGGYGLREPIKIIDENIEVQQDDRFQIVFRDGEYLLNSWVNGAWAPQYGFALTPQEWIEFSLANYFNATHPDTIFTQKKLAVIQTKKGRKILVDEHMKVIEGDKIHEEKVEYFEALHEHFCISG